MHAVVTESEGRARVVRASGELDAYAAPDVESTFSSVRGERSVLADLARVSFLDSTVLGLLVRCVRELRDDGTEVRVVLPEGSARRIFEITALDSVLPVSASRPSALAELDA